MHQTWGPVMVVRIFTSVSWEGSSGIKISCFGIKTYDHKEAFCKIALFNWLSWISQIVSRLINRDTMLVSFGIRFIRQDQKQRRNGEACRAKPTCFWSSLINLISIDTYVVFYLSCIISRFNGEKTVKQMKSRLSFVPTCSHPECIST